MTQLELAAPPRQSRKLSRVHAAIVRVMSDGRWRTKWELREDIGCIATEHTLSARMSELERWHGYAKQRRQRAGANDGVNEYRIVRGQ